MNKLWARTGSASWGAIAIFAIATLWVAVALGQLNSLLGAMHVAGSPSFTISALAGGPARAENVLKVWTAHDAEAVPITDQRSDDADSRKPPDAEEIVTLLSRLDTFLLVPLYLILALLFFLRAAQPRDRRDPRLPYLGIAAVGLTASFDVVENVAQRKTIAGWSSLVDDGLTGAVPSGWARTLQIAATCKWASAAFTVLVAALVGTGLVMGWLNERTQRDAAQRKGQTKASAKRAHVVAFQVVIAIVAIVLFNQQGQVADLYRRWQAQQAVLSLVALAFAGFALWAVTRRLIVRGTRKPYSGHDEKKLKRLIFVGVWVAAGVQLALHHFLTDARFDPGWGLVVPAVMLTILAVLGLGVAPTENAAARGTEPQPETEPHEPILPRLLATALVIGFAFALLRSSFGYAVYTRQWSWGHAIALLAFAAVGAALGIALRLAVPRLPPEHDTLTRRVVREPVTWAVLGTLVGIWALSPKGGETDIEPVLLITLSALLTAGGLRWYVAMGQERLPNVGLNKPLAILAVLVGVVVPAAIALFAVQLGQRFSVPGVAAIFVAAAALVAGLIAWGAPWLPMPRALRWLPAFPATIFLLVWFLAAAHFDHDGAFHDARILDHAQPAAGRTAQQQLGCWLSRRGLQPPADAPAPGDPACAKPAEPLRQQPVPLIVVASTGGGIRSAYWTATVLDCAFDTRPEPAPSEEPCPESGTNGASDLSRSDGLFALSGISGGSVGMAEYAAHLVSASQGASSDDWVRRALEVDGLSPTGARWLFVEIVRSFLQFNGPADRAAVLEGSFEGRWPDGELGDGLFAVERTNPHVPLLLLNSTSVADGCRFNVSVLDGNIEPKQGLPTTCRSNTPFDEPPLATGPALARGSQATSASVLPATRDLTDLLCGDTVDLRLSTASLLSARFPFVNPAGRVASRCEKGPTRVVHGVDGGYLDTSGASPVVELMTALTPLITEANTRSENAGRCVIPFMVQIDNGFDDSSPLRSPRRPSELLAPLETVLAARIARAAEARSGAALMFTQPFAGARYQGKPIANRYAHFVNEAHPGPGAPFGWAQSRFSQQELVSQLKQRRNRQALAEVKGWFDAIDEGKITCAT